MSEQIKRVKVAQILTKRADALVPGDRIYSDSDEVLTVQRLDKGIVPGHVSIAHNQGFSEVRKDVLVDLAHD